jgi:hypothetical protein
MRPRPLALLAALPALAFASFVATPRAQACWDGYSAFIGRVSLSVPDDASWSPPLAREVALWGSRIDALLPRGTRLDSELGSTSYCATGADGLCSEALVDLPGSVDDLPTLFGKTALLTRASPREIRRIMALTVAVLTVQVFASKSGRRAGALAAAIDAAGAGDHGFINVGGFPASNPTAHVIAGKDASGASIHRVVVGAFLTRGDAAIAEAGVRKALGLAGFVRPL